MVEDTIVALATGSTVQAIAIIRISGSDTYQIINKIINKPVKFENCKRILVRNIIDINNNTIDEVVLICYKNPTSFTGEDVIEINCHGSILIINKILQLLISNGARMAMPGEFTRRAFLNDKLDLLQAQAVNELINATNNTSHQIAIQKLSKKSSILVKNLDEELLSIIAQIMVNIDNPEYDGVEQLTTEQLLPRTNKFLQSIDKIIKDSENAQLIEQGIKTVIIGKPNVGKSTLLNALLNEDKAITSNIAGTTRDIVEGKINLENLTLNLIDTAGIRNSDDLIENLGIEKSKQYLKSAQLILLVLDSSKKLDENDYNLIEITKNMRRIIIYNKSDLNKKLDPNNVTISALNKDIDNLVKVIKKNFYQDLIIDDNTLILSSAFHQGILQKIRLELQTAIDAMNNFIPLDLVLINLQEVWNQLQQIINEDKNFKKDLLDTIFSTFCLGK